MILSFHFGELTEGRRPPAAYIMSAAETKAISLRPGCTLESFCIGYYVPVCQYQEAFIWLETSLEPAEKTMF